MFGILSEMASSNVSCIFAMAIPNLAFKDDTRLPPHAVVRHSLCEHEILTEQFLSNTQSAQIGCLNLHGRSLQDEALFFPTCIPVNYY